MPLLRSNIKPWLALWSLLYLVAQPGVLLEVPWMACEIRSFKSILDQDVEKLYIIRVTPDHVILVESFPPPERRKCNSGPLATP